MRHINHAGLALLKSFESLQLKAYLCPAEKWTIGYGSTGPHVKAGMVITEQEAERLLSVDLSRFEQAVEQTITVPLTDNQFSALVVWAFNIGVNAFKGSTLVKMLNAGDYEAVPTQLMRWNKANGKELPGLTRRRKAEADLFNA